MKRFLAGCMAWGLWITGAGATPPDVVVIDERLLGANADNYAVLRSEFDNLGSYYNSNTKVFLEERSKATGKNLKQVLLTDAKRMIDPEHEDPATQPKVTVEVKHQDKELGLGDVLARYPLLSDSRSPADLEGFAVSDDQSVTFGETMTLFARAQVVGEIFGGRLEETPVTVLEVNDQGSEIYLKLSKHDEDLGDGESHWACVGSALTLQVRAHRTKEPIYLRAGTFPDKAAALAKAAEWKELGREKKVSGFDPEIWSTGSDAGSARYHVVLRNSGDLIEREASGAIAEALGLSLQAVSGEKFLEWTPVK
ncbi:hypothetical protein OJ996_09985 [Luteolibacter sp. GHJ8]|uniref:Uncharacterized protein n=1 Tax=Luteolibacter rhizosphaerae TaxID=2989719 RepID=A0ABT3G255_9BACT|nr:hypothetical protein [Luteolibacter rhizosphaerae]MCW1913905.1 hypothetical protein [Luteolibacter rhizosphaerae]